MTPGYNPPEHFDLDPNDPLAERISRALRSAPETPDESVRKSRIAASLAAAAPTPSPMKLSIFKYALAGGGIALFLLAIAIGNSIPGIPGTSTQPRVAARLGFGALPMLEGSETASSALAMGEMMKSREAGASASGGLEDAARGIATMIAPAMPSPMVVVPDGEEVRCLLPEGCPDKPIPPEYLPPKVVYEWKGSALPEIPSELAVHRALPFAFGEEIAGTVLRQLGVGNLFRGELAIMNFTVRDAEYSWTFDAANGFVSFWQSDQNVYATKAAAEPAVGFAETPVADIAPSIIPDSIRIFPAPPQPPSGQPAIPADEAIRIANDFLASRGINLAKYGSPKVESYPSWDCRFGPCPLIGAAEGMMRSEGVSAESDAAYPIWYQPEVTVWYSGMIDGRPLLDWSGQESRAITVTIDSSSKKIRGGNILIFPALQSSLYPTVGTQEILEHALRGGLNPYWSSNDIYPPEIDAKRPTVRIVFDAARLGYFQRSYYESPDGATYFMPIVAFTGTVTDQYGNSSPWGTLVSALKSESFKE